MEKGSSGVRLSRLVFGALFTTLGIWMSAKIVLQLQGANAPWRDWLTLLFPALLLAVGILAFVAAARNYPDLRRPIFRRRRGPARIFGGTFGAVFFFSILITHLFRRSSLGGVIYELMVAAGAAGLLALLYGAVFAELPHDKRSGQ